jgi:NitT/TauT family transport system substrate-binding protein
MRRTRTRRGPLCLALGLTLLLTACQGGAAPGTTEPAAPTTEAPPTTEAAPTTEAPTTTLAPEAITVQMAFRWPLSQQYSTFLVGVPAGIYAKHGLDPEFVEGTGSATVAQLIATQQADFAGAVSSNAVMGVVNEGGEIKMIGETLPSVTIAVLSGGDTCIETPEDMVGATIAVPPGTTQSQMFPALLAANDIAESDINIVSAAADTLVPGFLSGQFEGYVSYIVSNVPLLRSEGVEPCFMLFSDYGVDLSPGETIIAHQALMDSNPDLVSRFVAAVEESHLYAVEHPDEACEAGVAMFPDQMDMEVCPQAVGLVVDQIAAVIVEGEPFVCIDPAKLAATTDLLVQYAEFQNPLGFESYATNEFAPGDCPA